MTQQSHPEMFVKGGDNVPAYISIPVFCNILMHHSAVHLTGFIRRCTCKPSKLASAIMLLNCWWGGYQIHLSA